MTTKRTITIFAIILISTVLDQSTKQMAVEHLKGTPSLSYWDSFFVLQYAENTGAMLGFGSDLPPTIRFLLLTVSVGILLAALLGYLLFSKKLTNMQTIALAFIAGGGISNFIDRVVNDGSVVDFMNMGIGSLRTGIFNVADVMIIIGLGLMLIFGDWKAQDDEAPKAAVAETAPPANPATSTDTTDSEKSA